VPTTYDAKFKINEVFPADDLYARLVVGLSIALCDLRLAGRPHLRDWDKTPDYAQM
jgi:hypothetical protein